jgi:hypothetical protein
VDDYVRNRLILPKVVYNLSVLKASAGNDDLVADVERFLSLVVIKPIRYGLQFLECLTD